MGAILSKKSTSTFAASYAPTDRATCKKCRKIIAKGSVRLSRELPNNWTGDSGSSAVHYHLTCGLTALESMRCVVPAGERGVRWRKYAHDTPEPKLTGVEHLKDTDSKNVARRFAASKAKFMKKCVQG